MVNKKTPRFWEIDFLRGIAIIMMIIYHILFDLYFLKIYYIKLNSLPVLLFLYPIGTLFLLLVGISLSISNSRIKYNYTKSKKIIKHVKRGSMIFGWGLIITLITWILIPDTFIIFGVLHCIGISIIISYPFINLKTQNLILGLLIIPIGIYLRSYTFDFSWFLWLGFIPNGFRTLDYFPLLPWFGVVLIGIYLGNILYPDNKRIFKIMDLSKFNLIKSICFMGRHSLLIYLVHQPIIILIMYIFFSKG